MRKICAILWGLCFCGMVCAGAPESTPSEPSKVSRVFYMMDAAAAEAGGAPDPRRVRRMVDALVMAATGQRDVVAAWRSLVSPEDVVGLKVSASAGVMGGTRVAVAEAVAQGLRAAGLSRDRIVVWDRELRDLLAAGYRSDSPLYTLRWIEGAEDYDSEALITAPVLGRLIWGDRGFGRRSGERLADLLSSGDELSNRSFLASLLTRKLTKVINLPSALDSISTGIHGALASMTLPNLDNWRRFVKAPYHGDPYIAEIYADPRIRDKVVLTLLDALWVQYAGGPMPQPNCVAANGALFASTDPVALDATLLDMIEPLRKASKLPEARPLAGHVESAEALGLGNARPSRIETLRADFYQTP
ncbi:MAG: DUF362 domain-containing protein [Terrimicrobiaceae bacterium]|nr:DUF362 domain-containing protein [Terrimicrobiaceae bacterium]